MLVIYEIIAFGLFVGIVATIIFVLGLIILLRRILKPTRKPDFLDKRSVKITIITLIAVGIICILYGYLIEPRWIEVTHLTVHSDKIPSGQTIRIVQISDLHIESEGSRELKVPELIKGLNPDIIILTGDYLNSDTGRPHLDNFIGKLKAPYGVYAVAGNFEWWFKSDDIFLKHGIQFGTNNIIPIKINETDIALLLGNLSITNLPPIERNKYNIFVYHTPDLIPDAAGRGFDLYLCGHTHGGQVRLPFYGALVTFSRFGKRYEMGYYSLAVSDKGDLQPTIPGSNSGAFGAVKLPEYRQDRMDAYVNRGLGMEGGLAPRVRFLSRPEIALVAIKHTGD